MNKKQKTLKKRDVSEAGKMCFYMGGYGYSDRGLAHFGHFDHCGHYHDVCCC
jgi:hypothetical protein